MTKQEITEIEQRARAASPQEDFANHCVNLFWTKAEDDRQRGNAHIWYDDGDQCAEVWQNLGLGANADDYAALFCHARDDILKLVAEIREMQMLVAQLERLALEHRLEALLESRAIIVNNFERMDMISALNKFIDRCIRSNI